MLRSFRLGNHRSFRDEHELLLMPVFSKDRGVLPVAAIYGANASGKSNLLDGLRFMAEAVRDSFAAWPPDAGVPRRPFKLAAGDGDKPSVFVIELIEAGVRYTYGFEVDDERVREEWLYSYPEKRRRVLFERDADGIRIGSTVAGGAAETDLLRRLLRSNSLLLSLAAQSGLEVVAPVHRWFVNKLLFRNEARTRFSDSTIVEFLESEPSLADQLVELLKIADLGISGVHLRTSKPDELWGHDLMDLFRYRVRLAHGTANHLFDLDEESAGTLSWLMLLPSVLLTLRDGGTLVIDEIDASLHPRLTAALVGLFRDAEANARGAQLLFTTHDASLLSPVLGDEVLGREDVWFVAKGDEGASELYALTDFKPRKEGENLERRYLGGSYGAIPDVRAEEFVSAVLRGADGEA